MRRRASARVAALAPLVGVAAILASCSQLIGLRDDLDVADSGGADAQEDAALDVVAPGDAIAQGEGGGESGSDAIADETGIDAAVPACTAGGAGLCLARALASVPTSLAATGLFVYYADSAQGLTRMDAQGLPATYTAGSGLHVSSIAALGASVAFAASGPGNTNYVVTVTALDGSGGGATAANSSPPTSVALTTTAFGWVAGASSLSATIANPSGTQSALPLSSASAISGGGALFALLSAGPNYSVRTCGPDGTGGATYTLPAGATAVAAVDPAGNAFAAHASNGTTTLEALSGGTGTNLTSLAGTARGLVASASDLFVALDPAPDAGAGALRSIVRVSRANPLIHETLHATPSSVGLVAHDGTYAYWVESASASSSKIYRWK